MRIEFKRGGSRGGIELFLLGAIVIGAFFLVGGLGVFKKSPAPDSISTVEVVCCDTGNGDSCKPQDDKTITYNGVEYGLLRSRTEFVEGNLHLQDSGQKTTINGAEYPIILNSSNIDDNFAGLPGQCTHSGTDKYLTEKPAGISISDLRILAYCRQIPNDQVIFVCKKNCVAATSCPTAGYGNHPPICYGNETSEYDAYFRLSDYDAATKQGVPDFIKNCSQRSAPKAVPDDSRPPQTLVIPGNVKHDNLQLNTFNVIEPGGQAIPWFSPFCKPAIYLYPPTQTTVSVQVDPFGPFTYTTPLYTNGGWNVVAFPDGKILSNQQEFPYLYYEADIPQLLIPKPTEGYSVSKDKMNAFLYEILPKLGLNAKETNEMASYWAKSLPQSPYYFVGIIPESVLNSIAPLSISPAPQTTIRIALYFEELQENISVSKPVLSSKTRTGFTVVEWGGIVKTDKPFVCLQ